MTSRISPTAKPREANASSIAYLVGRYIASMPGWVGPMPVSARMGPSGCRIRKAFTVHTVHLLEAVADRAIWMPDKEGVYRAALARARVPLGKGHVREVERLGCVGERHGRQWWCPRRG